MFKRIKLLFPKKGSVLIFSLIILAFMLVSALSLATVSVTEKRASFSTERSSRSFQVADSGVELILQKIYKGNYSDLNLLAAAAGGACTGGIISDSLNSGSYKVSFYKNDGTQITDCGSITWRDDAVKIKSEGVSGNTTRAVEVAVAAPSVKECRVCLRQSDSFGAWGPWGCSEYPSDVTVGTPIDSSVFDAGAQGGDHHPLQFRTECRN